MAEEILIFDQTTHNEQPWGVEFKDRYIVGQIFIPNNVDVITRFQVMCVLSGLYIPSGMICEGDISNSATGEAIHNPAQTDVSTYTAGTRWVEFVFPEPVPVTRGTGYFLRIRQDRVTGNVAINPRVRNVSVYPNIHPFIVSPENVVTPFLNKELTFKIWGMSTEEPPPSGIIQGDVMDSVTEQYLSGVTVHFAEYSAVTDAEGHYKIDVLQGYSDLLWVEHPGYERWEKGMTVGPDDVFLEYINLIPTAPPPPDKGYIRGRVTDSVLGTGIPMARITFQEFSTISDAFGYYVLEITAGYSAPIKFAMWGYVTKSITKTVGPGDDITVDMALDKDPSPDPYVEGDPKPWWEYVLSFDDDGVLHIGPELVIVSKLQQWLEDNVYGDKASPAVKAIFYTILAAVAIGILAKIGSGMGKTATLKLGTEIQKDAPALLTDAEIRWLSYKGVEAATAAHPVLSKILTVFGISVPLKSMLYFVGGIVGYDLIATWLASDNIVTGTTFPMNRLRDMVVEGTVSKEDALLEIQRIQEWKDYSTNFISISGIINPFLWLFRSLFMKNTELAQLNINQIKTQVEEAVVVTPPEEKGKLTVNSSPVGAKIYIDLVYTYNETNTTILVDPGTHTLTLKKSGYEDLSVQFSIAAAEELTITRTLSPVAETVTLTINSTPTGAEIFVDGASTGSFTNATITAPAGYHSITLKKAGYKDHIVTYNLSAGESQTWNVTLIEGDGIVEQPAEDVTIPLEPAVGGWNSWKITIKGVDSVTGAELNAWVLIDDVFKGVTTPAVFYLAPESTFNIKLRLKGYRQGEITYTTKPLPTA